MDRRKIAAAIFPALLAGRSAGTDPARLAAALACAAEGYPFPTNLDRDANVDGLTPLSQYDLVARALAAGRSAAEVAADLEAYEVRHRTDDI